MRQSDTMQRDTYICTHLGDEPGRFHGAVVPPLYENSLFVFPTFEAFIEAYANEQERYVYWRGTNPTVEIVERKLAALEDGESCKCFASGMAAICAAILNSVEQGGHVVCAGHLYTETKKLLDYMQKFGVSYSLAPSGKLDEIEQALRPETRLIYLESPSSFTFRLVDLAGVAALARSRGIRTIADNTWATPLFQKPLRFGIDMVVHSASKYLGGHSDLVGGAIIGSRETMSRLFHAEYLLFGAAMAPYEAWLMMRGLRTLPIRMRAIGDSAQRIARYLECHPAVAAVHYPGLSSHPDHELAARQMSGCSGLMSFQLLTDSFEAVKAVIDGLKLFQIGVSWGSYESLAFSPSDGRNGEQLRAEGIGAGLIRLSIGLEHADDLIADLDTALKSL